jgi:hypothetical protein
MPYVAPLTKCKFLFDHVVAFSDVCSTARFGDSTSDVTASLLSEAGKVCEEVLAPLQRVGDIQHAGSRRFLGCIITLRRLLLRDLIVDVRDLRGSTSSGYC